jgi:uncharacterized protein YqjF (DUF2071 family)
MHWPVPARSLRPLIPGPLAIDTYGGVAYVGITPFTTWGLRPALLPAVPLLSTSHEINVRTYVHLDGIPEVWFFSLDANNPLAVWGARLAFHLPYFTARMSTERQDRTFNFASRRTHRNAASAAFEASWTVGDRLPQPDPDSLEFFLIERYCLYAASKTKLYRARIFHRPWSLHTARLLTCRSTMIESQELPSPEAEPLLHQQGDSLRVQIWPPARVR